jgi:large subunit ribosomal protein L21
MASTKAIIAYKGLQFNIQDGQSILVPYSKELAEGDEITLREVLFLETKDGAKVGRPTLPANVTLKVEESVRDPKVIVFKHSRKHKHHRVRGHRQKHLKVRVVSIQSA